MTKLRGVNLGGWLIAERWIYPSLFDGTEAQDEYSLLQTPDGAKRIKNHQKTFIVESDFAWLAENGINAVRIPIGYWILEGDDPYIANPRRLDWAMRMAKKYKLQVVLSMHGAPGGQNGHDHSGRIGALKWHKDATYRKRTIDVLEQLAKRYHDNEYLWGIELLNEPKPGIFQRTLRRFYRDAYERLVKVARPGVRIVFHDGFTPRLMSGTLWARRSNPVVMDVHWYHFAFALHQWLPLKWYYWFVAGRARLLARLAKDQPVIVGEWSMVVSTEVFRRYPESDHQALINEHARRQMAAYQDCEGWFYWTYKTEQRGLWHFRSMIEDGHIRLGSAYGDSEYR